jgi:O-antigen ligase
MPEKACLASGSALRLDCRVLTLAIPKIRAMADGLAARWRNVPAPCRFAMGVAAAYIVWRHRSWALQDAILWCGVLLAFARFPAGWTVWKSPAGAVALACLGWIIVQAPFGAHPSIAARDMARHADTAMFALAIPALFPSGTALLNAMAATACAFTAVVAYDLARLAVQLGPEIMAKAHAHEPFIWTHSNIAAMVAGMAAIVMICTAWLMRSRPWITAGAIVAAAVNVVYLAVIGSRGPQIAFAGALLAAIVVYPRGWKWRLAFAVVAVVAGFLLFAFREQINPRFADVRSVAGLVDRDKVWQHTWTLVKERPVAGYGFGDKVFMESYHTPAAPKSPHRFYHPHQHMLGVLFSFGAVGLILVLALWGALTVRLLRACAVAEDRSVRVLSCALFTLLAFIHIFSLADCPTNATATALVWIVPAALVATRGGDRA